MSKSHLFLKNEFGYCLEFNRTRGRDDIDESSDSTKNYRRQRENLSVCRVAFEQDLENRHELRSQNIVVDHIDMLAIDFLKIADSTLTKRFCDTYGLAVLNYSNMNQTVLFAIADDVRFQEVFLRHLNSFLEENDDESTDHKLLTVMASFKYWGKDLMCRPEVRGTNNLLIELTEQSSRILTKQINITRALEECLNNKNVDYKLIEPGIYQIDFIGEEDLCELLDNFDVIHRIQSLYNMRIQPNSFGDREFITDASLRLVNHAPTIGIIDTGVQRLPVLNPIIEENGIDLVDTTHPSPYEIDLRTDSSHGTTVATLAAFGNNFYRDITAVNVEADAKIFSIKIQRGETGLVDIAKIRQAIIDSYLTYGIRIFNLSMSVGIKAYNQDISTYAYLLDELAFDYDLLIFISVGNLSLDDIKYIQEVASDPRTADNIRRFLTYPNHYYNPFITLEDTGCHDGGYMNLCEPSESMNNMSIGAIAESFNAIHGDHGLSLGRSFPAYYSRKFHIDYNSQINGTRFKANQRNKNLFKPDIVMPGGDQLDVESRMLVLSPRMDGLGLKIEQNSGTSYATPLAANIAAKIVQRYPTLNMQSVKALIINSAKPIDSHYLDATIENLKTSENRLYPDVDRKEKAILSRKYSSERLSKYISGHGIPDISKCLESDDNRCTFIVEDEISFDSHKVVNLNIPEYLVGYSKKGVLLTLTATLCYKFKPKRGDVLSYCPVHIAFNFGNSMNHDDPGMNAEEYARNRASEDNERMAIKSDFGSWSDDFYPASSKMFSNVQKMTLNISRDEIEKINNQMSIIFRCTGRDSMVGTNHPFSFVLTIEQRSPEDFDGISLYDSIEQVNIVEAVAQAALEAEI